MGYPLSLALRYLRSKKRASISVGTLFAILGVALGVAALATVMSVTGGFQAQFREKVLGVNAHVLVMTYSSEFRDYRDVMDKVKNVPGVVAVAPFTIKPMMLTNGEVTATGVLLKGVDPRASLGVDAPPGFVPALDLPRHITQGEAGSCPPEGDSACGVRQLQGLRPDGATPPERSSEPSDFEDPFEPDDAKKVEPYDVDLDASVPDIGDAGPVGSIVPDGGYKSVLPDDDGLIIDREDVCADPVKVKAMPGIIIGVSLAKTLNLTLGDCVTVTSPTIGYDMSGGTIRPPVAKRFRVMALFEVGFDQYDSKLVYTDLYEAQRLYNKGDTVTGVEMRIADIDKSREVVTAVTDAVGTSRYQIIDWKELNHGLFTALLIQQIGMSVVLALIILVAAFTVVATLIMVVLDKKREIAVIKAMGATDFAILRIFLYQGGIIGALGTSIGLALGLFVCLGLIRYGFPLDPKVYFISHLPVLVRPFEFIVTGAIAVFLCLTATILPALYAARIRPADGFREQ